MHICSLDAIRLIFFLWNTNNTDRNGVNKQKRFTKHFEKDNVGKGVGGWGDNYEPGCFWIFVFDSGRESSNDVNTFLNLRFIKKQKLAGVFLRKYYLLTSSKLRRFIEYTWTSVENSTKQNLKKSSCDFENSLQFLRYFQKSKDTWYLHAYRYLKNCNYFWG